MKERTRFVFMHEQQVYSMTELCERFSISRKTGYKWLARFEREGLAGLRERGCAPHTCPHRTSLEVELRIVEAFHGSRYKRGPRKLRRLLQDRHPDVQWPPTSTFGDILKRHGLTSPRTRRARRPHSGAGALQVSRPNELWTADYKGEVMIDGRYCYPLTIQDAHTRMLLHCKGLRSVSKAEAWPVFEDVFCQYGLPEAIRTDNGPPFVSTGWLGLTRLAVWWLKLGISHQRIAPGKPQQNPRHERMHRTLKKHAMTPPSSTMEEQQHRFDDFRDDYNHVRPHEALDDDVPDSRYTPSLRAMPKHINEPTYPGHFEVRKVSDAGRIKFKNRELFLSTALAGEYVGLEEIDCEIWDIVFCKHSLARYSEQSQRIT